jgi:hypothetical protein
VQGGEKNVDSVTQVMYLWITSDPITREIAICAAEEGALRQMIEDLMPDSDPKETSLASDLLGWLLDKVDWDVLSSVLREGAREVM